MPAPLGDATAASGDFKSEVGDFVLVDFGVVIFFYVLPPDATLQPAAINNTTPHHTTPHHTQTTSTDQPISLSFHRKLVGGERANDSAVLLFAD